MQIPFIGYISFLIFIFKRIKFPKRFERQRDKVIANKINNAIIFLCFNFFITSFGYTAKIRQQFNSKVTIVTNGSIK